MNCIIVSDKSHLMLLNQQQKTVPELIENSDTAFYWFVTRLM